MTNKSALSLAFPLILTGLTTLAYGDESQNEVRLDSVTVTAQRVEENIQDVPISITSIDDEKLNILKASGADVRFLSARVPSVIAESSFGRAFPRFYIRGFGNIDFDLNATQPVSLVYDDVPFENPILKGFPVFDIESIEVLRGPQGTLFGRNTPGGIIKFDSVKPSEDFDGYYRIAYGSYGTSELEGAVGGLISEDLTYRISGLVQHRNHYIDNGHTNQKNVYGGFDEIAFRVQTLYEPSESTSFLLNLHSRDNDSTARLFRANIIDKGTNGVGKTFIRDTVYLDSGDQKLKQKAFGTTLTARHKLSETVGLVYVFGWESAELSSRGDIDGGYGAQFLGDGNFGPGTIPFPSESGGNVDDLKQTTHELRLEFELNENVNGQAGLFVFNEEIDITSLSFNSLDSSKPKNGEAVRSNDTESLGIFVSLSYTLDEQISFQAGLRHTQDDKSFVVERKQSPEAGGRPIGPFNGQKGDDQVSWDLSAVYAVNDEVNAYVRVARGYRGPSIQGRLVFGNAISVADSETVVSFEAGVKSELFNRRLRANANIFSYTIKDQQLTVVGGQTNTVQLLNADEGQGVGFEFDVEAAPTSDIFITAGLSYNKTEIKDDVLLSLGCGAPVGCTILDPRVTDDQNRFIGYNISGNSFPNAPKWIANFTGRYIIPYRKGSFYGYTDWAFKGDTNFFLYESKEYSQDGYWEGGLRFGYKFDNGYDVSVFVRNLTDYEALTGGIDFNNLTGYVNQPRTFGITLNVKL